MCSGKEEVQMLELGQTLATTIFWVLNEFCLLPSYQIWLYPTYYELEDLGMFLFL